jgi:hypothetical protein
MALPQEALELVERFCAQRAAGIAPEPPRLEYEVRGSSVTIVERRPPWDGRGDWSATSIAQLRHDAGTWTLFWPRHTGRWECYDTAPASHIAVLLAEIDADPDGVFWG